MLEEAARRGLLGGVVADHRAHSEAFARVVRSLEPAGNLSGTVGGDPGGRRGATGPSAAGTLADIGSGAGVPGLILAEELPELAVTLVERREGRASWLEEASGLLHREGVRVEVCCADVYDLAHGEDRGRYDVVTARAFGGPVATAELGGALVAVGGVLVVSEPPDQPHRWEAVDLAGLGLVDRGTMDAEGRAVGDGRAPRATTGARFRVLARRSALVAHRPRRRPRP